MEEYVYTDIMVDIETTGLDPDRNAILQIGAIAFEYDTMLVDSKNIFKRSLGIPVRRFWDEDTEYFWKVDNKDVYFEIASCAERYDHVLRFSWLGSQL